MAHTHDQQPRTSYTNVAPPIELLPLSNSSPPSTQHPEIAGLDRHAADKDHDSIKPEEAIEPEDLETVPLRYVTRHPLDSSLLIISAQLTVISRTVYHVQVLLLHPLNHHQIEMSLYRRGTFGQLHVLVHRPFSLGARVAYIEAVFMDGTWEYFSGALRLASYSYAT
jgi:hypothetical protein